MSLRRFLWMLSGILVGCWFSTLAYAAAPVRDNTYVVNTEIEPEDVRDNEDTIFDYLQAGVDTYAPNSITTAAIATGAVTSADILDGTITTADLSFSIAGGALLPSGAIYFLLTGSCPSGTTDVSATYSNMFIRVNATAGTQGGASVHNHGAGTFAGSAHTHSIPNSIGDNSGGATDTGGGQQYSLDDHTHNGATGSGGGGAISGTSGNGDNIPPFVTAKLCQVN